ncbi:conserved hypothetical protein [Histoplasma capsulatum H143]|uniref:Aminoglycoside phosphotransferase domain-containing protein n=1 Tax=Ajellomyces capsulatus (strain H143) TaxID=544712 RepID=C6HSR8_AJECH|nr:conserved hypothetical protein [Histoplasma capsulatum H143]
MPSASQRPKVFRYAKFNIDALCCLASRLRGGISCHCDSSQAPFSGSLNWAISIHFIDGVEWLLRSPLNENGAIPCPRTNSMLLESEAATLKYLRSNSSISVPEVFAYSCSKENDIGIPYILMSKAPGSSLQPHWTHMSSDDKAKILRQLGSITWQLCQLKFDRIGSLFEGPRGPVIKTCLARGLLVCERHTLPLNRGPFTSTIDFYKALISAFQEHASILPLNAHCFLAPFPLPEEFEDSNQFDRARDRWHDFVAIDSKIDGSDNRTDYMIVSDLLADMREKWVRDTSLKEDSCYFSLHHPDISVNNIFIDEEYNITCLIDWAFCSSVPLSLAIAEPGLPQSRHELPEVFREEFRRGFSEAAYSTSNRADPAENALLCRILQLSRPMWLISRLLSFDTVVDYPVLNDLWVITNPNKGHLLEEFKIRQSQDTYMGVHALLKEDDDHSRAAEEKHFKKGTQVDLTVARKLTLVSQWSSRYGQHGFVGLRVASSAFKTGEALWKWIDRCMIDLQEMYG